MNQVEIFFENFLNKQDKRIFYKDYEYSYSQILQKSYDLARVIENYDYKHVFSNLRNSPLSICLYLATWIANIDLFVPINPRLIDYELESILTQDCLFITDKASQIKKPNMQVLLIDDSTSFLDKIPKTGNLKVYAKAITAHVSSGTTGFYKKHSHNINQIIQYAYNRVADMGLYSDDHILVALSMNHAYAFSYQLLPGLAIGIDITLVSEFDAKLVVGIINQNKITALALLPSMYYFLLQENISSKNKLRYLSVAGDVSTDGLRELVYQKLGIPLLIGIGMTEVFGYGQNINKDSDSIKIFDDTEVKIAKFKNSHYGKIFIKNHMLPLEIKNQWLETGDIGSFDDTNHELTFYGRYKDLIIKGGSNISPLELERAILKIKAINNCIVVGKKDKIWGETIWAVLVSDNKYSLDFINTEISTYIAAYKKLDGVIYIDQIPVTTTAKTDRKKLQEIVNNEY